MTDLIAELRAAIEAARVPDLMTPSQVAEYLGVSEIHLCQLRKERRGPPFLAISPKVVRYVREDVMGWACSFRVPTAA